METVWNNLSFTNSSSTDIVQRKVIAMLHDKKETTTLLGTLQWAFHNYIFSLYDKFKNKNNFQFGDSIDLNILYVYL